MWFTLPMPAEPNVIFPGLAFACSMSCASVLVFAVGLTMITNGDCAEIVTGTRSFA
jgi:hypothetical protein